MLIKYSYASPVERSLSYPAPGAWIPAVPANCIRLHAGYPASALVPVQQLRDAATRLFDEERDAPLQYVGSPHAAHLLPQIEGRLRDRGIDTTHNRTLITAGSAQAINLVAQTLLERDSVVIVERPTYMEVLETLHNFTDCVLTVAADADGLCTDELEALLQTRAAQELPLPKLVYTIASYQNPTGATLSAARRTHLLELAERYDFLIAEDDAYGELSFADIPIPLKALDRTDRVIHLGSLSKVIAPGLRVGWVTAHPELVATFERFKKDLSHPITEATVSIFLSQTDWLQRLDSLRSRYRHRRDTMLDALERFMPDCATWTVPDGGYFIWVHLPGIDTAALLQESLTAGVSYVSGRYFHDLGQGGQNDLRLSFSHVDEGQLPVGVETLAEVVRRSRGT